MDHFLPSCNRDFLFCHCDKSLRRPRKLPSLFLFVLLLYITTKSCSFLINASSWQWLLKSFIVFIVYSSKIALVCRDKKTVECFRTFFFSATLHRYWCLSSGWNCRWWNGTSFPAIPRLIKLGVWEPIPIMKALLKKAICESSQVKNKNFPLNFQIVPRHDDLYKFTLTILTVNARWFSYKICLSVPLKKHANEMNLKVSTGMVGTSAT